MFTNEECVKFVQAALAQEFPMPELKYGKKGEVCFMPVPTHFALPHLQPYHNAVDETLRTWRQVDLEFSSTGCTMLLFSLNLSSCVSHPPSPVLNLPNTTRSRGLLVRLCELLQAALAEA